MAQCLVVRDCRECPSPGQGQVMNHPVGLSEGASLHEMMRNLASTLVHSPVLDSLERHGHGQMQTLAAWQGQFRQQGLPHELVGKGNTAG